MTTISQLRNGTLDTAIAGASLNALANAAYALGATIDNRETVGTVAAFDMADLTIQLSSAVTTGAGTPNIVVWILPAVDGTNYPSPPGASAGAAPLSLSYTFQQVASVSTQTIVCRDIPIPPYQFKVQLQNNLSVALPATGNTAQLARKTVASW